MIREVLDESGLRTGLEVIRRSFQTVADDLGLTRENCPSNPAFMDFERLSAAREKGIRMFGRYSGDRMVGFVALEKAEGGTYYLERLAVLPECRHGGLGKELMDYAFDFVRQAGGLKIGIAIVHENTVLKDWYNRYGFTETGLKKFDHLPFTVCFMEKRVD